MAPRRTAAAPRPSPPLQALLSVSGLLARGRQGAVFSEALEQMLEGLGLSRGAVYEASEEGLSLVAEQGLPATLRAYVQSFPTADTPWFPAQRAAKTRRYVHEPDAATACAAHVDPGLLGGAGWGVIAAAPIALGREVLGVLLVAAPAPEAMPAAETPALLETIANMLALSIARERAVDKPRDDREQTAAAAADAKLARLAVLGALAAGFADEMRWPLSSLGSQLDEQEKLLGNLRVRYPGVASAVDDLSRIHDEAATALRFARAAGSRLLSAIEESTPEPFDLAEIAHEAAALVEPTARAREVDILVTSLQGEEPVVVGRRSELGQLLLSLLTNAIDACAALPKPEPKDGEEPQKPLVCVTVAREKGKVALRVEDAGPGIAPDVRPRIFEPFFTTKKGALGLGLTLARQVVQSHAGTLELGRSDLGGALVRVALPSAPAGTIPKAARSPISKRLPVSMPATDSVPSPTVREGWTAPPKPIAPEQTTRRPVRAPQPSLSPSVVIMADTDVCAPTQRVPGTPAEGVQQANAPASTRQPPASKRKPPISKRKPSVAASPSAAPTRKPTGLTEIPREASPSAPETVRARRTSVAPPGAGSTPTTDRVPEAPTSAPRSRKAARRAEPQPEEP
jgi:signal transduction histidine kinase